MVNHQLRIVEVPITKMEVTTQTMGTLGIHLVADLPGIMVITISVKLLRPHGNA